MAEIKQGEGTEFSVSITQIESKTGCAFYFETAHDSPEDHLRESLRVEVKEGIDPELVIAAMQTAVDSLTEKASEFPVWKLHAESQGEISKEVEAARLAESPGEAIIDGERKPPA